MATKLKFNKKIGKKILALLLSVLTVFTCITPVMSVLADSSKVDPPLGKWPIPTAVITT